MKEKEYDKERIERLKEKRKKLGVTLRQLEAMTGLDFSTICKIENCEGEGVTKTAYRFYMYVMETYEYLGKKALDIQIKNLEQELEMLKSLRA